MMGMHVIDEQEDELGTPSSSSWGNESTNTAASNSSSDSLDDATSSPSSSSSSLSTFSSSDKQLPTNPLYQMSDLMEELPIKRGLSRHFQGKSQSFSSLCSVRRLEDLVKPQPKPCKKRPKWSKSLGAGLDHATKPLSPIGCCSRTISKKPPFSAMGKRYHPHPPSHHHRPHDHRNNIGFHGARPPTHHHHCSGNPPGQALLIA